MISERYFFPKLSVSLQFLKKCGMLTCFLEERIFHLDASHSHFGGIEDIKTLFLDANALYKHRKIPPMHDKIKICLHYSRNSANNDNNTNIKFIKLHQSS